MSRTIVLQSHKRPLPSEWIGTCLHSVKSWAMLNDFEYHYYDDRLFDFIDDALFKKLSKQLVIATDLARLKLLQSYLAKGYETVIWCDADFLIFSPEKFKLLPDSYALGREVWIQQNSRSSKLVSKIKVHNAFMMFRQNNTFLDFYAETAERLLNLNEGSMSPQFIGPKLLSALHNITQCPVAENAGMLSPLVIKDISSGGGPALDLFLIKSKGDIAAANLCNSLYHKNETTLDEIVACMNTLLSNSTAVTA